MEKIKSIEVDKWSEPDENHRVKIGGLKCYPMKNLRKNW